MFRRYNMNEKELGNRIKSRRMELKISQKDLADAVGLIQAQISQIEIGERRIDMLKELPLFAKVLVKPIEWFITEEMSSPEQLTLESVIKEKCPSLGELNNDDLNYLKDFIGDIMASFIERDQHFSKKVKKHRKQ